MELASEQVRVPTIPQCVSVLHGFIRTRTVSKTDNPLSLKTSFYFYCWGQKLLPSAKNVVAKEKKRNGLNCSEYVS